MSCICCISRNGNKNSQSATKVGNLSICPAKSYGRRVQPMEKLRGSHTYSTNTAAKMPSNGSRRFVRGIKIGGQREFAPNKLCKQCVRCTQPARMGRPPCSLSYNRIFLPFDAAKSDNANTFYAALQLTSDYFMRCGIISVSPQKALHQELSFLFITMH